ncbi:MAG: hypothetical protein JW862_10210, partial [Anaerolineales bacterium]|nr:hypothetical protein [Anaerolineales bacterium]
SPFFDLKARHSIIFQRHDPVINYGLWWHRDVRKTDSSIVEFKDIFRLMPVMPNTTNRDPEGLKNCFEESNKRYKGLDWELEDLLPEALTNAFFHDFPTAIIRKNRIEDKVHSDLTRDGKAKLHQFIRQNAIRSDLEAVISVLKVFWLYLGIKSADRR